MTTSPRVEALAAIAAVALVAVGCAPKHPVANPSPFDEDDPGAGASTVRGEPRGAHIDDRVQERSLPDGVTLAELPVDRPEVRQRLTVDRGALQSFVERGPRALLRAVPIEAHTDGDRLLGWRVASAIDSAIDLRAGDLIRTVNGSRLERPEHLQAAWEKLDGADRIIVVGTRNGRPFELWFDLAQAPPSADP